MIDRLVNSMKKYTWRKRLGYRMQRQTELQASEIDGQIERQACEQDGRAYLEREGSEKNSRTNFETGF